MSPPLFRTAAIASASTSTGSGIDYDLPNSTRARKSFSPSSSVRKQVIASMLGPTVPGESELDREIDEIVARISARHAVRWIIIADLARNGVVKSLSMVDGDGKAIGSSSEDSELVSRYAGLCVRYVQQSNYLIENLFDVDGSGGKGSREEDSSTKESARIGDRVFGDDENENSGDESAGHRDEDSAQIEEDEDILKLIRLRTKLHELIIVPDSRFLLAIVHDINRKP
ncbi:hypothetical protein V1511DRAFT_505714 [Dipodascopsis uninucleata]